MSTVDMMGMSKYVTPKLPLHLVDPGPHLIHGSLGPLKSRYREAPRSVQSFLQGSPMCPTHTQADRHMVNLWPNNNNVIYSMQCYGKVE